jgi:hypothetical protein
VRGYDIEVQSDHFQVLVGDAKAGPLVDTSGIWNVHGNIGASPGDPTLVAIGTTRFGGRMQLTVIVGDDRPPACDARVLGEFVLDVPSGEILFWAPESDDLSLHPRIRVAPGMYSGIAIGMNLELVSDEMEQEGLDRYGLHLSLMQAY